MSNRIDRPAPDATALSALNERSREIFRGIVDSWLTYQRQQERSTAADAMYEERLQHFRAAPDQPARHYLIER